MFWFYRSSKSTNTPLRKVVLSLADCEDLRVVLTVLYIITEVMRYEKEAGSGEHDHLIESFIQEICMTDCIWYGSDGPTNVAALPFSDPQ